MRCNFMSYPSVDRARTYIQFFTVRRVNGIGSRLVVSARTRDRCAAVTRPLGFVSQDFPTVTLWEV
jgi:hypothetical protein